MITYQHKAIEEESCDKVDDKVAKPKDKWSLDHNEKKTEIVPKPLRRKYYW